VRTIGGGLLGGLSRRLRLRLVQRLLGLRLWLRLRLWLWLWLTGSGLRAGSGLGAGKGEGEGSGEAKGDKDDLHNKIYSLRNDRYWPALHMFLDLDSDFIILHFEKKSARTRGAEEAI